METRFEAEYAEDHISHADSKNKDEDIYVAVIQVLIFLSPDSCKYYSSCMVQHILNQESEVSSQNGRFLHNIPTDY